MRVLTMIVAVAMSVSPLALAQGTMQSGAAELQASMAQAQAAAIHPGDDALTCDQLQADMGTTMNSQEVRANAAELGETARAQQQRAQDMRAHQAASTGANIALGVAGAFIPGMGYAQAAAQRAQMAQQMQQAHQAEGENAAMMGNMSAMMPNMMRGQRLAELADAKHCPFMEEARAQAQAQGR